MKKISLKKIALFFVTTVIGGIIVNFISNPISLWIKEISFKERAIIVTDYMHSSVKLRSQPNYKEDSKLALLKHGDEVIIVGINGKFTEVVVKRKNGERVNINGYVDSRYIEK